MKCCADGAARPSAQYRKGSLPMSDFLISRLQNVRRALTERDSPLDALLLTDLDNIGYVSGFTGSTAYALVTPDEAVFLTDSRYTLRALAECRAFQVRETPSGSGGYGEAIAGDFAGASRPAPGRV